MLNYFIISLIQSMSFGSPSLKKYFQMYTYTLEVDMEKLDNIQGQTIQNLIGSADLLQLDQ